MKRAFALIVALAGLAILGVALYVLFDIRQFEWPYIARLFGIEGIALVAALTLSLVLLVYLAGSSALGRPPRKGHRKLIVGYLMACAVLIAWVAEWVFMETPLTVMARDAMTSEKQKAAAVAAAVDYAKKNGDLAEFAAIGAGANERDLAVMLARVAVNRPDLFQDVNVARLLASYGAKYKVDPLWAFWCLYNASFYGEAPAGPMPFFRNMTAELFRDIVQVHLPWWFIENSLRLKLVESDYLVRVFGSELGFKLRYAIQKANYDVSVGPFDYSLYSDLFIVMERYESEYPELTNGKSALDKVLAESFARLKGYAMMAPYGDPHSHAAWNTEDYGKYRDDLIIFGRAAFYKSLTDLDFAARTQTLVATYFEEQYSKVLGRDAWESLPPVQQMSLQAMHRDLYTPNIGRMGFNMYVSPEILSPAACAYTVDEALEDLQNVIRTDTLWVPPNIDYFWGAAKFRFHVLAEVWEAAKGTSFGGLRPAETVPDSVAVLARNRSVTSLILGCRFRSSAR